MQRNDAPDATYTNTWTNGRGEVRFFTRPDGSRLRYYTVGSGPALVLMHTVRGQLDYFQRVIPQLWDHYTIYAIDLPGMGWSDIVPGAQYEEPQLRAAVVDFVRGLDLHDVSLSGESLGGALSLSASIDLKDRVTRVVAFNSYDYPEGGARGNWIARLIISSVRMPVLGPVFAHLQPRLIMRAILQAATSTRPSCPRTSSPNCCEAATARATTKCPAASSSASKDSTRHASATRECRPRSPSSTAKTTGPGPPNATGSHRRWPTFTASPCPAPATSPRWSAPTPWPGSCSRRAPASPQRSPATTTEHPVTEAT